MVVTVNIAAAVVENRRLLKITKKNSKLVMVLLNLLLCYVIIFHVVSHTFSCWVGKQSR